MKDHEEISLYIATSEVRVVAYLLHKLKPKLIRIYSQFCPFVEIKQFESNRYPEYVGNLKEYRWKPLLIAEILEKHDIVFWFDTSITFKNGDETLTVRTQ